jgi:hypothetical protein
MTQRVRSGSCDVAKNPHLPAAAPAGLLSRKVTGEVRFGSGISNLKVLTGAKPRILILGAGLSPRDGVDAEGSVKPTAGFTFNKVISPSPFVYT